MPTVSNYFSSPTANSSDNPLELSQGNWSINGIPVTASADDINSGGGGGGIDFSSSIFVDPNGDDSNSGRNISEPKKTIASAIAAAKLLPGVRSVVGLGFGIYDESVVIDEAFLFLYMPASLIAPSSGDAITVNVPGGIGIAIDVGALDPNTGDALNIIAAGSTIIRSGITSGDGTWDGGGSHIWVSESVNGNYTAVPSSTVNCHITQTIASTFTTGFFGRTGNTWTGGFIFNGETRLQVKDQVSVSSGTTLSITQAGQTCIASSGSTITINLDDDTAGLPIGYQTEIVQFGVGQVIFNPINSAVIIGADDRIEKQGGRAFLEYYGSNTWSVSGNVNSPP